MYDTERSGVDSQFCNMWCGFEIISVMYEYIVAKSGCLILTHLFSSLSSATVNAPSASSSFSALDVKNGLGFFCFLRDMSDGSCRFSEDALGSGGEGGSAGGGAAAGGGGGVALAADCSFTAWMVESIDRTEKSRNISRV